MAICSEAETGAAVDGHTLIAGCLRGLGTTHVYGLSGTPIDETLAACATAGMRPVGVRHQQAAVLMAAAHNYAAGKLAAVAIVSAGPAVTNTVTGILVARDNGWPVVVLGGRRPLSMRGWGCFQELDAEPILRPVTKHAGLVKSGRDLPEALARAFRTALSGRPGPVYLDVAEEALGVTRAAVDYPAGPPAIRYPTADPATIEEAAELLIEARRPAMILGKGLRWSAPYEQLRQLAGRWGVPFVTSPMGKGYLSEDHPRCYTSVRAAVLSTADVVLCVGARLDWTFRFGAELARDARLIHVDIEATELGRTVPPAVGIVGDARQVLNRLVERLERRTGRPSRPGGYATWIGQLDARRRARLAQLERAMRDDRLPMSPWRLAREIRDFVPRDCLLVIDGHVTLGAAQQCLPSYRPAYRFTPGSNGCIGTGIPFAIGAQLACPDRRVLAICGDTSVGMTGMELETAARYGVPIVLVVANNGGIGGSLRQEEYYPADYPDRVTTFQPGIRYDRMMQAVGVHGAHVEDPRAVKPALARAFAAGQTACVDVVVDPRATQP